MTGYHGFLLEITVRETVSMHLCVLCVLCGSTAVLGFIRSIRAIRGARWVISDCWVQQTNYDCWRWRLRDVHGRDKAINPSPTSAVTERPNPRSKSGSEYRSVIRCRPAGISTA